MQNKKQSIKVSRQKIEEVTSLIKKIQQLTGKKVIFEDIKQPVKESKEDKLKKIKSLVKMIESKTGKKVVFGNVKSDVKKKIVKESINQPGYQFYVCEILQMVGTSQLHPKIVINEGFDSKEDAVYRIKEQKSEGHTDGLTFKILSGRFLKSKGVDPNNDSNWGNPSYIK